MLKEAPMLYSHASKLVKKELKREGLNPSLYSLHSLWLQSTCLLEIPDRLFKKQGGWRRSQAKNNLGIIGLLAASYEEDSWLRLKTVY